MKPGLTYAVLLFIVIRVCNVSALPLMFSDRNAFLAAGGPAVVEDFEDANVLPNSVCNTGGPALSTVDSGSTNDCIDAGDIAAGISFQSPGFAFLGSGAFGSPSIALAPPGVYDVMTLLFAPAVQAVALDFLILGPIPITALDIHLFDTSGRDLRVIRGPGFFGVIVQPGEPLISSVSWGPRLPNFAPIIAIDNVAFDSVAAVPEPGTLMLLQLALLVALGTSRRLRLLRADGLGRERAA